MQILQILYKCCKYCKHCWIANSQGQTFPKGYFLRFQRGSWSFKGHWGEVSCLNHHEDYCQTFLAIYVIFSGKFGVRAGNRIGGGGCLDHKGDHCLRLPLYPPPSNYGSMAQVGKMSSHNLYKWSYHWYACKSKRPIDFKKKSSGQVYKYSNALTNTEGW